MAGANYEVNIQLKADPALKSLERIEQKINKLTKTSVDLQDARGAAMVKNRNLADRINKLEEKGVKVAKMRERLGRAIEKTDKGSLRTAAAHEKILRREVKNEEKLLRVKKDQLKVDRQQARSRGPGRAQGAILGGGFPLLFGGSPFQAAAGAIGGAAGGFAGGIGLQVLAGQIEKVLGKAAQLGQGLNSLTFDLDGVITAAGFANTETANLLERIEQYGDSAVAARLATELLEKRIGVEGVKALKDFGKQAGELGSALSTIFSQVLASIAQAAGPLLNSLAKFANQQADIGAFKARTGLVGREKLAQDILTMGLGKTGTGGLGVGTAMAGGLKTRAKELGITDLSDRGLREFAMQTATESQRAFELPTLKAIEFEASQVQDPSQRAAGRKARSKEERQQLKEFLELNKQMTLELDRQEELDRIAGEHIAKQLNDADKISSNQEKRRARLEGIINGTEREVELRQAIKEITERGLLPADEARLIAAEKQIAAMEDQAEEAERMEELAKRVGSAIESGIVNGIMSAVEGAQSLQDILAGILKDVAAILLQFAVRTGLNAINPNIFPMAEGGYVTGPTRALVGEGGESEYVIPESKMRESMSRYSRGARGSAVIPGNGGGGGSMSEDSATAVLAPIDVRYTVERINSVDYVTADQFQAGMRQAATQGAKQGEQQTLKRLQMSGSTRKRLGL